AERRKEGNRRAVWSRAGPKSELDVFGSSSSNVQTPFPLSSSSSSSLLSRPLITHTTSPSTPSSSPTSNTPTTSSSSPALEKGFNNSSTSSLSSPTPTPSSQIPRSPRSSSSERISPSSPPPHPSPSTATTSPSETLTSTSESSSKQGTRRIDSKTTSDVSSLRETQQHTGSTVNDSISEDLQQPSRGLSPRVSLILQSPSEPALFSDPPTFAISNKPTKTTSVRSSPSPEPPTSLPSISSLESSLFDPATFNSPFATSNTSPPLLRRPSFIKLFWTR
ncbi:hypothetical protein BDY24DRAFT_169867, partial [Mrakia frigida]|uniref:uncharacterized protein n=1 Tax=Mrakia frigida TaxID=29902 RepID=UPI003FCC0A57